MSKSTGFLKIHNKYIQEHSKKYLDILIGANNKFHIPFCEPYSFSYRNSFGNQMKQRMISKVKEYL